MFVVIALNSAPQPVPHAAAVRGVKYSLSDTHSSRGCPCPRGGKRKRDHYGTTDYTTYNVSYSAVNITIIATNAAGHSPPVIIQVPAEPATDLKSKPQCICAYVCHICIFILN